MHPVVEGAAAIMTGASDQRVIRTPDQRLRVFVSSTLKELQPERLAARGAIERLHLAPVMFELGARPHPPRELYRAYLDQSDVFLGIYWQEYGWIAPDEDISGLEDEYCLAPREMPKLVYVKQPAEREERLAGLVERIRDDDTTSYKSFSTAEELGSLIESDLAILLAERFDASRSQAATAEADGMTESTATTDADDAAVHLPLAPDELLGRETDLMTLLEGHEGDPVEPVAGETGRWSAASSDAPESTAAGSTASSVAGARDASNRSASSVARSPSMSSVSSSAVSNVLYEVESSPRISSTSFASRSSRCAGCFR